MLIKNVVGEKGLSTGKKLQAYGRSGNYDNKVMGSLDKAQKEQEK